MTPPASFSMQEYSALPETCSLSTLLATSRRKNARTLAPRMSSGSMWETSNRPQPLRTAWCSSICEP